jgi:hypothetical protein
MSIESARLILSLRPKWSPARINQQLRDRVLVDAGQAGHGADPQVGGSQGHAVVLRALSVSSRHAAVPM